jgi:hypothetical protein
MLASPRRPAFYAVGRGRLGDAVALLHPPYTAWHLSYVALGAAVAPHIHVYRLEWALIAFALAVGVAAHALDELHDRPLGTRIGDRWLLGTAALSLGGALAIGIGGVVWVSPWLAPFVLAGALFVPAYNLELGAGRLHSDLTFALGWGAFPALTGYFVNSLRIGVAGILIAAACAVLSVAQRRLSRAARELRRRTASVSGTRTRLDGSEEPLTVAMLLGPLDAALLALSATSVLLAAALLVARL